MSTYVIGDIHGGLKALNQCLERANIQSGDTLIFLGDYVDGWSESAQVIEYLMELAKKFNCIFIKGNHDEWCQQWLNTGEQLPQWTTQGGRATLNSYSALDHANGGIKDSYLKTHREFFNNLLPYYIDDKNRGFVHGGYSSFNGLGHDHIVGEQNYWWDRDLMRDAYAYSMNLISEVPKQLNAHAEVYIGHTSTIYWKTTEPMNCANLWNVDTGGSWHGKLTIMNIDTKEYWQSDTVKDLYPNDPGR